MQYNKINQQSALVAVRLLVRLPGRLLPAYAAALAAAWLLLLLLGCSGCCLAGSAGRWLLASGSENPRLHQMSRSDLQVVYFLL